MLTRPQARLKPQEVSQSDAPPQEAGHLIAWISLICVALSVSAGCDEPVSTSTSLPELDQGSIGVLEDMDPEDERRDLGLPQLGGQEVADMDTVEPEPDMDMVEPDMDTVEPEPDMDIIEPDMDIIEPDMDIIEPDMDIIEPDMDVVEPDMDMVEPDMDMVEPDMDMVEPDMDMVEPDMDMVELDMGPVGLEVGASCARGGVELDPELVPEARCIESECLIDPQWDDVEALDEAQGDVLPVLGTGVCDDMTLDAPLERVTGLACDAEELRYRCEAQTVCFDPVEADGLDDPRVRNGDGVCLSAHPILTNFEERELSLSEGDVSLHQLVSGAEATLVITPDERCDPQAGVALMVARRVDGVWSAISYASSDGAACPSIELSLARDELTYVLARRGAFTGLPRDPALDAPLTFGLTFELRAPDRDGDGTPDEFDCEPDNPDIPIPFEIPGNGIDDDCEPFTPDEMAAEGSECDRANAGLGCADMLFCLQGDEDGVGVCGQPPEEFVELELNDRCDVYEVQNGCPFIGQLCFDAALRGFEGLDDPESPESRSLADGDGRCVLFEPTFEDSGVVEVAISEGAMLAVSVFAAIPSSLTVELVPTADGGCPLDPEIKLFSSAFSDFGFISVYEAGADAGSADMMRCAQLTVPFVNEEAFILVNSADVAGSVEGQLNWTLTPIP